MSISKSVKSKSIITTVRWQHTAKLVPTPSQNRRYSQQKNEHGGTQTCL
jgi:hypothetical protein